MFEKIMYKVKDNVYRIRDFTSGDNIEESKFVEGVNQRGKKQLQTQVCILYKDEYTSLNQERNSLKSEVQHLKAQIHEYESEISKLKKEIKDNKRANVDEVMQLTKDKYTMKEDHHKEVSNLHQTLSDFEKTHLQEIEHLKETQSNKILELTNAHHVEVYKLNEEISTLKQTRLEDLREKDKSHNDEVEKIRTSFLNLLTNVNTQDINEIREIQKEVPSILKPFMRKHLNKLEELKDRKQANTPERIIKTYDLIGEDEKEQ